jgi:type I restriction enzyme S subunit
MTGKRRNAEAQRQRDAEEENLSDPQRISGSAFQETDIGLIPTEWKVVPLRDLAANRTSDRDPREKPDKVFRYVEISGVSNESYRIEGWRELKGADAPSRARKIIRGGDTLFSTVRPYLRNIAQVPPELDGEICTTGFCVLRTEAHQLDLDYLYFYALTNDFVNRVVAHQSGSSYPAVSNRDVLSEPIPLPPLPEQRRIAGALHTIQEAIAAQEDVIAAARELKRSLMERVFTYGPGAEPAPTKETEIGEIPEHWEVIELQQLITSGPQNGMYKPASYYGTGTPILRIDAFDCGDIIERQKLKRLQLSAEELEKYGLSEGDFDCYNTMNEGRFHFL